MDTLPDDILHCIFARLPHFAKIQYAKSHRRICFVIAPRAGFRPWRPDMPCYDLSAVSGGDYIVAVQVTSAGGPAAMRVITSAGMPVNPYLPVAAAVTVLSYNAVSRRAIATTDCRNVLNIIRLVNSPDFIRAAMRQYATQFHVGVLMWSPPGRPNIIEFESRRPPAIALLRGSVCIRTNIRYSYMDVTLNIVS